MPSDFHKILEILEACDILGGIIAKDGYAEMLTISTMRYF